MKKKFFAFLLISFSITMKAQLQEVSYSDGNQKLIGYFGASHKETANQPGILILPAWKGIDQHSKDVSEKLNALGFHTFIADIYGVGNYPKDTEEASKLSGYYKKYFSDYQKRIQLALNQLITKGAHPNKIVIIGYCFGGTGALEAVRGQLPVKGAVSFHGGLGKGKERTTQPINAKILILHGADDPYVPEKDIISFREEMKLAEADWQMISYSGAVHAFTEKNAGNDPSKGAAYNPQADMRSFKHLIIFLEEVLNLSN